MGSGTVSGKMEGRGHCLLTGEGQGDGVEDSGQALSLPVAVACGPAHTHVCVCITQGHLWPVEAVNSSRNINYGMMGSALPSAASLKN